MGPPLLLHRLKGAAPDRVGPLGQALLDRAEAGEAGLAVVELAGRGLLLGRHQRGRSALDLARVEAEGLTASRRSGGGRALEAGEGRVAVLLALPRPDTYLASPAGADKVLNRHARGLLAALRTLTGLPVVYFGRDELVARPAAGSRALASISQDGRPSGAVLLEALVAIERGTAPPEGLDGYPPHGDAKSLGAPPTTVAELTGRPPSFDELVEAVSGGYAASHGAEVAPRPLAPRVAAAPPGPAPLEDEAGLEESGVADVAIGFAEALVRHDGARVLEARLRGDFIAPAFAVRALEASLAGVELAFPAIGAKVDEAFRLPFATVLGLAKLRVLADAVLAAAGKLPA